MTPTTSAEMTPFAVGDEVLFRDDFHGRDCLATVTGVEPTHTTVRFASDGLVVRYAGTSPADSRLRRKEDHHA